MAIGSSTSGSSGVQSGFGQLKLQQARRNADLAEQTAQSLQAQAQEAGTAAGRAEENARSLAIDASQAQTNAGRARQGLAAVQSASQMQPQLAKIAEHVVVQKPQATQQPSAPVKPAPVVNTQGQVTGRVINTTA